MRGQSDHLDDTTMKHFNSSSIVKYAICAILSLATTSFSIDVIVESGMTMLIRAGYSLDAQHAGDAVPDP